MYQIGRNVLGFQFHPEMTPHALALLIENEEDMAVFKGDYGIFFFLIDFRMYSMLLPRPEIRIPRFSN